jgi:hypothetical protein
MTAMGECLDSYAAHFEAHDRMRKELEHLHGLMRSADDAAISAGIHTGENLPPHVYIATMAQQAKLLKAGRDAAGSVMLDLQRECIALRTLAAAVVAEYRTDLRVGRWSDALLKAMDDLRAALEATNGSGTPKPSPAPAAPPLPAENDR